MDKTPVKAVIWGRVSTKEQHTENQLAVLREWAGQCGLEIVDEMVTEDSAWAGSKAGNGRQRVRSGPAGHAGGCAAGQVHGCARVGYRQAQQAGQRGYAALPADAPLRLAPMCGHVKSHG